MPDLWPLQCSSGRSAPRKTLVCSTFQYPTTIHPAHLVLSNWLPERPLISVSRFILTLVSLQICRHRIFLGRLRGMIGIWSKHTRHAFLETCLQFLPLKNVSVHREIRQVIKIPSDGVEICYNHVVGNLVFQYANDNNNLISDCNRAGTSMKNKASPPRYKKGQG